MKSRRRMRSSRSLRPRQSQPAAYHTRRGGGSTPQREGLHTADVLKDLQLPRDIAGEPLFEGEWK